MHHAFLVGDKVYLRRFEETDLHGDYFDWLNDYEVTRYLDSGTFPNSEQSVEHFFCQCESQSGYVRHHGEGHGNVHREHQNRQHES